MHSYQTKHLEQQLDQLTYPAKLSTAVKRLIVASWQEKIAGLRDQRRKLDDERRRLYNVRDIGREVSLEDVPSELRGKMAALIACRKQQAQLENELEKVTEYRVAYDGTVHTKPDAKWVADEQRRLDLESHALRLQEDEIGKQIVAVAQKLADEQIKAVKEKIPAGLREELDAISPDRLLTGVVVGDGQ